MKVKEEMQNTGCFYWGKNKRKRPILTNKEGQNGILAGVFYTLPVYLFALHRILSILYVDIPLLAFCRFFRHSIKYLISHIYGNIYILSTSQPSNTHSLKDVNIEGYALLSQTISCMANILIVTISLVSLQQLLIKI